MPKKHLIISSLVFLILLGMSAFVIWIAVQTYLYSRPTTWKEYSYAEEKFMVSFPNKPEVEIYEEQIDEENSTQSKVYSSESKIGNLYFVVVAKYPVLVESDRASEFLEKVVQGTGKSNQSATSTILSSKESQFDGHPAMDYLMKITAKNQSGFLQGKFVLVADVMYGLQEVSADQDSSEYKKFVDSFSLVE